MNAEEEADYMKIDTDAEQEIAAKYKVCPSSGPFLQHHHPVHTMLLSSLVVRRQDISYLLPIVSFDYISPLKG